MRFDRLVLFILGSGQVLLKTEVENCVNRICEGGMDHGMRIVTYDPGMDSGTAIDGEIRSMQEDPLIRAAGLQANWLHCIFLINDSMTAIEWNRCITSVKAAIDRKILASVTYTAIVQKDNLNMKDMADALTRFPMRVLMFGRQSQMGFIFRGEDEQLMSHYGLLAACGMLPNGNALYAGAFNKLNLMESDFDRIRQHYVVEALSSEENQGNDLLFLGLFGRWVGEGITADARVEDLCDALSKKLRPLFPSRSNLAVLANKDERIAKDNVNKFICLNYADRESDSPDAQISRKVKLKDCYIAFLERFDRAGTTRNKPESVVASWIQHFRKELDTNPDYYCAGTIAYIRHGLIDWLERKISRIKTDEMTRISNIVFDAADSSIISEKNFINETVDYAEKRLMPFVRLATAYLLQAIIKNLKTECETIEERLALRERILSGFRLSSDQLTNYKYYAPDIMKNIADHCKTYLKPSQVMGNDTRPYYNSGEEKRMWERLINNQCDHLKGMIHMADPIEDLNNKTTAEFDAVMPTMLHDNGYRIVLGSRLDFNPHPITIYLYSSDLTTLGTGGKEFPDWNPATCRREAVQGLDNILQLRIVAITTVNPPEKTADLSDAEYMLLCMRAMIADLPDSFFSTQQVTNNAPRAEIIDAEERPEIVETAVIEPCKVSGDRLLVTLPVRLNGDITCIINGYNEEGTIRAPQTHNINPRGSLTFELSIRGFYGHCSLKVSGSQGTGINTKPYENSFAFNGPNTEEEPCKRKIGGGIFDRKYKLDDNLSDIPLQHVIFTLQRKHAAPIEARLNLDGGNTDMFKDTPLYPIGSGVKWDVYAPDDIAASMVLEANDPEGVRRITEY